jgi:hypothetical protein
MNPARKKKKIMHLKIGMDSIIQGDFPGKP